MIALGRSIDMLKRSDVDEIEKLIGQLEGHHKELSSLAKKSPNDAVNGFKLKFVNSTLLSCNDLLSENYKPFIEFITFDIDDVPSNSDVTFIISQYMQAIEKMRSDNVFQEHGAWYYKIDNAQEKIRTAPPIKLNKR